MARKTTLSEKRDKAVCVVGLGYVGLPLAVALARQRLVVGVDSDRHRIAQLSKCEDRSGEISSAELRRVRIRKDAAAGLVLSTDINDARDCSIFAVTAPTPLTQDKRPDLSPLVSACESVGRVMKKGALVVIESTVFPGVTREICAPALARSSGLRFNRDFFCGYSPERVSPGDKARGLADIPKLVSGSTPAAARRVADLYRPIVAAGIVPIESMEIAEAAKVFENTQRDVNIALVNEFALICDSLGIDTGKTLAAAASKWNFLPFRPGLVGGHCIGVDPHYLTYKAELLGYRPDLILAARQINDGMADFVVDKALRLFARAGRKTRGARALILGWTFKENCPDDRNTQSAKIRRGLLRCGFRVAVCDPRADAAKARERHGVRPLAKWQNALKTPPDLAIFAVAHDEFRAIPAARLQGAIVIDAQGIAPRADWRL